LHETAQLAILSIVSIVRQTPQYGLFP
jgi:hypothetical protein